MMTKFDYVTLNHDEIVMEQVETEACFKSKEQHMGDYLKSMKALDDAMEPFKEQKKELKEEYVDNGWLTKKDITLAMKAYRLAKDDTDMSELIDMVAKFKKEIDKG